MNEPNRVRNAFSAQNNEKTHLDEHFQRQSNDLVRVGLFGNTVLYVLTLLVTTRTLVGMKSECIPGCS